MGEDLVQKDEQCSESSGARSHALGSLTSTHWRLTVVPQARSKTCSTVYLGSDQEPGPEWTDKVTMAWD